MHTEKLKSLSDTAKLASEKCKPFEVKDLPGLIIYPENAVTSADIELMKRVESTETLGIYKKLLNKNFISINGILISINGIMINQVLYKLQFSMI